MDAELFKLKIFQEHNENQFPIEKYDNIVFSYSISQLLF